MKDHKIIGKNLSIVNEFDKHELQWFDEILVSERKTLAPTGMYSNLMPLDLFLIGQEHLPISNALASNSLKYRTRKYVRLMRFWRIQKKICILLVVVLLVSVQIFFHFRSKYEFNRAKGMILFIMHRRTL